MDGMMYKVGATFVWLSNMVVPVCILVEDTSKVEAKAVVDLIMC